MKNLAKCKPTEFVKQTVKIKKAVERWLTDTDIMAIRKRLPKLQKITPDMSDDEREQVFNNNKAISEKQMNKNLSDMLNAMLEEHPEETLEVLALICFVEPKDVDKYCMEDYLKALSDMMSNEAVVSFFTSLLQLGLMNTSNA